MSPFRDVSFREPHNERIIKDARVAHKVKPHRYSIAIRCPRHDRRQFKRAGIFSRTS